MSIGKRIPLVVSIAFQAFSVKALSIDEHAALPPTRQNQPSSQNRCVRFKPLPVSLYFRW